MNQLSPDQPPQFAVRLLNLFIPDEQRETIPGDLLEEFADVASKSGIRSARSWFWRQTIVTIAHMLGDGLRSVRVLTAVVTAGLLGIFGIWLNQVIVIGILYRYQIYLYVDPYWFWFGYAIVIGRFLIPLAVGFLAGFVAKGREMAATVALAFLFALVGAFKLWPFISHMGRWNDYRFPRPIVTVLLSTAFISPIAITIGGCIRRTTRSLATK